LGIEQLIFERLEIPNHSTQASTPMDSSVGIMNYVFSLIETYLMNDNLLGELSLDVNLLVEDVNKM